MSELPSPAPQPMTTVQTWKCTNATCRDVNVTKNSSVVLNAGDVRCGVCHSVLVEVPMA